MFFLLPVVYSFGKRVFVWPWKTLNWVGHSQSVDVGGLREGSSAKSGVFVANGKQTLDMIERLGGGRAVKSSLPSAGGLYILAAYRQGIICYRRGSPGICWTHYNNYTTKYLLHYSYSLPAAATTGILYLPPSGWPLVVVGPVKSQGAFIAIDFSHN